MPELTPPILLYDGICGFCNRSVQFIMRRDPTGIFRFAALQSTFASQILTRHGANPTDLDTLYVVVNYDRPDEALVARSDASVFILKELGGIWTPIGSAIQLVPRSLRDWGYRLVARNRYRIFGRYETCPLPSADTRSRFLDQ